MAEITKPILLDETGQTIVTKLEDIVDALGGSHGANKDLSNLSATGNAKFSKVSVSDTGTATDEINYITIDGTEKKIAGGGGGSEEDNLSITKNASDKIQTVGVINQKDTATIAKVWVGKETEITGAKTAGIIYFVKSDPGTQVFDSTNTPHYDKDVVSDGSYTFSNANANNANVEGSLQFTSLTSASDSFFYYSFYNNSKITSVSFPALTSIGNTGFMYAFGMCPNITNISFPVLATVSSSGLYCAFQSTKISSISFPSLASVGSDGFGWAFQSCNNLTEIHFPAALSGSAELTQTKMQCPTSTSILFDL